MTSQTRIVTRPDGSIDTAFYMSRGRHLRSVQAHRLGKQAAGAPSGAMAGLARLVLNSLRLTRARA